MDEIMMVLVEGVGRTEANRIIFGVWYVELSRIKAVLP